MTNETPQPNANVRRQSCMEITVFIDFSGEGSALITAWLEVRVLPGPPRIPTQPEISRQLLNSPDPAFIGPRIDFVARFEPPHFGPNPDHDSGHVVSQDERHAIRQDEFELSASDFGIQKIYTS